MIYTFKFQIFVRLKGGSLTKKKKVGRNSWKKSSKNIVYFEEVQYPLTNRRLGPHPIWVEPPRSEWLLVETKTPKSDKKRAAWYKTSFSTFFAVFLCSIENGAFSLIINDPKRRPRKIKIIAHTHTHKAVLAILCPFFWQKVPIL